jgi:hypothetical protein
MIKVKKKRENKILGKHLYFLQQELSFLWFQHSNERCGDWSWRHKKSAKKVREKG